MIDKVDGKRTGSDINNHLIDALIAVRDCLSDLKKNKKKNLEDDYKRIVKSDDYKYKGYAGFYF
jgi:site-specific DNA-adenine methylase